MGLTDQHEGTGQQGGADQGRRPAEQALAECEGQQNRRQASEDRWQAVGPDCLLGAKQSGTGRLHPIDADRLFRPRLS